MMMLTRAGGATSLAAFCVFAATLSAAAASADATCHDYGSLSGGAPIRLGRIRTDAARINFVKGSDEDEACPSASAACRVKAFLVPGDAVILGGRHDGFLCADYVGATGQERTGWISADAVEMVAGAPAVADWMGRWRREEATIVLKPAKGGGVTARGDATYGAKDPGRMKRGAVNIGSIEGTVMPTGADLSFTMGQNKTLPIAEGDQYDCRVWMKRLGPWLLVDDNNNCGGMNVTFRGTYVREK